ncbi:hypothetical protein YC2023_060914 [Brassica napus]
MKLKLSVNKDTHVENIIKKIKSKVVLSHKDSDLKLYYPKLRIYKNVTMINLQAEEVHEEKSSTESFFQFVPLNHLPLKLVIRWVIFYKRSRHISSKSFTLEIKNLLRFIHILGVGPPYGRPKTIKEYVIKQTIIHTKTADPSYITIPRNRGEILIGFHNDDNECYFLYTQQLILISTWEIAVKVITIAERMTTNDYDFVYTYTEQWPLRQWKTD